MQVSSLLPATRAEECLHMCKQRRATGQGGETQPTHVSSSSGVIGFGSYPGKKGTVSTAKHAGKSLAGKCRLIFSRGSEEWKRPRDADKERSSDGIKPARETD